MKKSVRANNKQQTPKTVTNGVRFKSVTHEKIVDYAEVAHKGNKSDVAKI